MFNLIVSGALSDDGIGSIMGSRVFQYTDDDLVERFKRNGKLNTSLLTALPTMFMEEGTEDQIVRVGWLYQIDLQGRDYELLYRVDPDVPAMTNAEIRSVCAQLTIENWEFNTNHWAVKDVDLFQFLYRMKVVQRPVPTVFQLSQKPVNPKLVSVMMPFASDFNDVYQAIKSAVNAQGYECHRVDEFWNNHQIMKDIVELICTSAVVICDLSGKNPNVFYETGITHTLGKEFILTTQHMSDVPFDLQSIRCITYHNNNEGRDKMGKEICDRLRSLA